VTKEITQKLKSPPQVVGWVVVALAMAGLGYVTYYSLENYRLLQEEKSEVVAQLEDERENNRNLRGTVTYLQSIVDSFQGQITDIGSTVGTLEKLAATDEELLRKYSKVYFLSENYVPTTLTEIAEEYQFDSGKNFQIHSQVWPHLEELLRDARADGIELLVASAFRSFYEQADLKSSYTFVYGTGANQFSADQGYSEHQLGTSVDFTTPTAGAVFTKFSDDPAYQWLLDNAYQYGFVLSYPEGNSYYKFEPWHWRFVGKKLARALHDADMYFYDMDQRDIDKYLANVFD